MKVAGILVCVLLALVAGAAENRDETSGTRPPTRIPVSGVLQTLTGEPRQGEVTLVLSIYADRESAEPLWSEEQRIMLREDGRYEVALGGTSPEGLASELFSANGARWVGIAEKGDLEQPRFMLVSVPYATKALDAEAIGGRPAGDFVLADELSERVASVLAGGRSVAGSQDDVAGRPGPQAGGARSFTLDLKPRSEADATVAAAGRFTNEATTGVMYGVHAHVHSTTGGSLETASAGVLGEVAVTNPGSWTAGVRGINRGTSTLGIGVLGVQQGSGWGVFGTTPGGTAVYGLSDQGIGVRGESSGSYAAVMAVRGTPDGGPALEVNNGGIKVAGSTRAAFVHTASLTSRVTWIDHPLANGQPQAMLFVTQKGVIYMLNGPQYICCAVKSFGVGYFTATERWAIIADADEVIESGTAFNVLVVNQ